MKPRRGGERAFSFARGVRVAGTNIVCDSLGGGELLGFLSHAQALGALVHPHPTVASGRHELLVTDATLALMGTPGARLRKQALPAVFGRPFVLGESRVELFPSGHLPGSASLLVEVAGRRLVYAGSVRTGRPAFGATLAELRSAEAVCVDGTFGEPRFDLPPPEEALERLRSFVQDAIAARRPPVLLTPAFGTAMEAAACLARAGHGLRAHRSIVAAAVAFRALGAPAPAIARFDGRLPAGEVLLWPPDTHDAAILGKLPDRRVAYVSGFSLDPDALARVRAEVPIPLSNQIGYPQLLAYIEATGAREVAVFRGHAEELAARLRDRGLHAYPLGPPTSSSCSAGERGLRRSPIAGFLTRRSAPGVNNPAGRRQYAEARMAPSAKREVAQGEAPPEVGSELGERLRAFGAELDYVYRSLRRHGVSRVDAEDLAQEVFLIAWRRRADFDRQRPLRPWLAGIATKLAQQHRRRPREIPTDAAAHPEPAVVPRPEELDARVLVMRVLANLPERHRAVLVLHELDGLSVEEIARRGGCRASRSTPACGARAARSSTRPTACRRPSASVGWPRRWPCWRWTTGVPLHRARR
jgi:RNA polymerase sigma factor (sigma-70 family)